jgi:2,4-dienoyl-CoA reductase-like NADH-dependent reductase (Old Yellow Enzyme family)
MTTDTSVLFQPLTLKNLTIPNRIVMAPMTRNFSPGGVPGQNVADYYRRRAAADVGLILTEGTTINRPEAANHPAIPHFHGQAALAGWQNVVDEVHKVGGKIAPQIWHTGAVRGQMPDVPRPGEPEGPSGLLSPGKPNGKTMTEEEIADTVAAFAEAAGDAVRMGFDTVELHGAHGYLIDQFFWNGTNERTDQWGGKTLPERNRFAVEVVKAVRVAMGADTPLILRVSQWKQQDFEARLAPTPDEMTAWLAPLVDAGVDILHCSQRRFWEPEFPELDGEEGLNFAGWAKKLTGAPTISVGSVSLSNDFFHSFVGQGAEKVNLDKLLTRMEKGEFDMIAVGRALISDPEWAAKVRSGKLNELNDFNAANLGALV